MNVSQAPLKILIVDDDQVVLFITESHLKQAGYAVYPVESVAAALSLLASMGSDAFSAIVSDYRMPEATGLDLLRHVHVMDPTLAVIMVTMEGEKSLVANSLRGGAVDFLDKPISGSDLLAAVSRAIQVTQSQRAQSSAVKEVAGMAQSQRILLGQSTALLGNRFRLYFRPHEKAGGDFVAAFPLDADRFIVLVSDVSGHDAQAAYRSAYLQGFARALLGRGCSIEDAFRQINELLMRDWNAGDEDILSLAACAACVNTRTRSVRVLNCGLPTPYLVSAEGWASRLTDTTTTALGWFTELPRPVETAFADSRICLWSDGVEDLAERLGCDPLALAFRLNSGGEPDPKLFALATDDIISVQFDLGQSRHGDHFSSMPIVSRRFPGSDHEVIDDHQVWFSRSFQLAVPGFPADCLHDVLICIREALLNALTHGCRCRADKFATLQATISITTRTLRVRITDDGEGHEFNLPEHEAEDSKELMPAHHGLMLIKYLTRSVTFSPTGNALTMEFSLDPKS